MTLTFRNLLITHVHTEASMGGAGAKVTEVMAEWLLQSELVFTEPEACEKGMRRKGQELRARLEEEASSQLSTGSSSAPLRTHRPSASR